MLIPAYFNSVSESALNIKRRPFDRFILGPFLIWYGLKTKKMHKIPRTMIISAGIYQIIYSVKDYQSLTAALRAGNAEGVYNVITNTDKGSDFVGLISDATI